MIRKLLCIVILCAGCIKDPPTGLGSITGQWTLQTVDGKSLPVTISGSGANQTQVTSDVFTLLEGSGFNRSTHLRVTVNGQATDQTVVTPGTYGLLGTSVVLRKDADGTTITAVIDGSSMSLPEGGMVKVYSK